MVSQEMEERQQALSEGTPDYKEVVRAYAHCRELLYKMISIAHVSHQDDTKIRVMREVLEGMKDLRVMDTWIHTGSGRSLVVQEGMDKERIEC